MSIDVGARLRSVRTDLGLSQRKLAARAGVANGLISQIEQNRTSPSIASLKLILDAVPMSLADFFDTSDSEPGKFFYRAEEMAEISPLRVFGNKTLSEVDGISFRQVGRSSEHQIQMLFETYEPGADTGAECYKHDAEEAGLVVSGEIELTVADETVILYSGDGYIFDSRKPHRFRNRSDQRCVLVSACTPPTF